MANDKLTIDPEETEVDAYAEYAKGIDNYGEQMQTAIDNYATEQEKIANDALDVTVGKLENEKNAAEQDYQKEQGAAYVDWKKQSDPYGVNAEKMADAGLSRTGYSESSQVRMYAAYQNRVAVARESYNRAVADYNIAIAEAQRQNSAILAEIAYNSMVKRLELSMDILTKKLALYESGGMTIYDNSSDNTQVNGTAVPTIVSNNAVGRNTIPAIASALSAAKKNNPNSAGGAIGQYLQSESKNPYESKVKATANRTALGQIYVEGYGWITWEKLLELVDSGKVQEKKENDKFVYTPVQSK